ncbi:MAG TPA: DUF4242 domain-containing protein [Rudaea sp.]
MKLLPAFLALAVFGHAAAADAPEPGTHRYIVERTFPKGALDGLDAAGKAKVNQNNAQYGVRWEMSYANAEKTKTFCVYDAPNADAIRKAAAANQIPVDSITEVPVTLESH